MFPTTAFPTVLNYFKCNSLHFLMKIEFSFSLVFEAISSRNANVRYVDPFSNSTIANSGPINFFNSSKFIFSGNLLKFNFHSRNKISIWSFNWN